MMRDDPLCLVDRLFCAAVGTENGNIKEVLRSGFGVQEFFLSYLESHDDIKELFEEQQG